MYRYLMAILLLCSHVALAQKPVLHTPEEAEMLEKIAKETLPDSLRYYYDDLGKLYYSESLFAEANRCFFSSLRYCEQVGSKRGMAVACNNIANVYVQMEKGKDAIPFALRAVQEAQGSTDSLFLFTCYTTAGTSYYIAEKYAEAIPYLEKAINIIKLSADSLQGGAALKNLAAVYMESGHPSMALVYMKEQLRLRRKSGDSAEIFLALLGLSEIYNAVKAYDSAAPLLTESKMYLASFGGDLKSMCAYYYGWYEVHFHTGRVVEAVKELENYHLFKDSIVNEDNLLAITEEKNKYQLEKKEQEVTRQRDIARREKNTRILSSVVFVALLLALTIFIFWLRARQRTKLAQAELKQQETERNMMIEGQESERKRIAGELHDGLVQELTAIAINLQNDDNIDKGQTIDRVMRVAHEARNIAHQMMPVSLMQLGLINTLEDLFQQTYTPLGIGYEFEHFTETTSLSNTVSVSLYRICQELVANSVKHAGATLVHILLRQTPQQIMLVFEDNGKGFDVTLNRTGIGMVSITSRVRYLNGEISFDSDDGAGTTAIVKIPLHNQPTTA